LPAELFRYSIYFSGEVDRGEFSLCIGDYCTGPLPWDATSETVANAVDLLGGRVASHSGGPLPKAVELVAETGDLVADEAHSLSGDMGAYFGGALISVVVTLE
jgi:hypothetical protein